MTDTLATNTHGLKKRLQPTWPSPGARGGIYIGGGVIGRLDDYFAQSGFRAAFEAKGRFENYMKRIPTYVIRAEQPALIGCAMGLGIQPGRRAA